MENKENCNWIVTKQKQNSQKNLSSIKKGNEYYLLLHNAIKNYNWYYESFISTANNIVSYESFFLLQPQTILESFQQIWLKANEISFLVEISLSESKCNSIFCFFSE